MRDPEQSITTTIRVSPRVWQALRRLAELRCAERGGRPSASGVISDLVAREVARQAEADRA
jgi:predicted transcriptional regulator